MKKKKAAKKRKELLKSLKKTMKDIKATSELFAKVTSNHDMIVVSSE